MLNRFYNSREFSVLEGKTLVSVLGLFEGSNEVVFICADGTEYRMYHQQDSAEDVHISYVSYIGKYGASYCGQLERELPNIILDTPILSAKSTFYSHCVKFEFDSVQCEGSKSTTMFTIQTKMGSALIIWRGQAFDTESSTEVDFIQTKFGASESTKQAVGALDKCRTIAHTVETTIRDFDRALKECYQSDPRSMNW